MNLSKLPDREDIGTLSSDKIIKPKAYTLKTKVAFEVNLSSEGEMDTNNLNKIYTYYFLGQQCYIRQLHLVCFSSIVSERLY